jgi:hypothetical protein
MVAALVVGLPTIIAGVPSLQSYNSPSLSTLLKRRALSSDVAGRYSALDNVSIIRLLRAHDAGLVSDSRARLIILTVFAIAVPVCLLVFVIRPETDNVTRTRRQFLDQTCEGFEVGWLGARRATGLRGLSERKIRSLFDQWGLASPQLNDSSSPQQGKLEGQGRESGVAEVVIEGIYSVSARLKEIKALDKKRHAILNWLEEAEVEYLAAWAPGDDGEEGNGSIHERPDSPPRKPPVVVSAPARSMLRRPGNPLIPNIQIGQRKGKHTIAKEVATVTPYGPKGAYTIEARHRANEAQDATRRQSENLQDSIGRKLVGSTFTEVSHTEGRRPMSELPIGTQVTIDEFGKLVRRPVSEMTALSPIADEGAMGGFSPYSGHRFSRDTGLSSSSDISDDGMVSHREGRASPYDFAGPSDRTHNKASNDERPGRPGAPTPEAMLWIADNAHPSRSSSSLVMVDRPFGRTFRPYLRPSEFTGPDEVASLYNSIRRFRSSLRRLNNEIESLQHELMEEVAEGKNITGWLLVGKGLRYLKGVEVLESPSKDGIEYDALGGRRFGRIAFWVATLVAGLLACGACKSTDNG